MVRTTDFSKLNIEDQLEAASKLFEYVFRSAPSFFLVDPSVSFMEDHVSLDTTDTDSAQ